MRRACAEDSLNRALMNIVGKHTACSVDGQGGIGRHRIRVVNGRRRYRRGIYEHIESHGVSCIFLKLQLPLASVTSGECGARSVVVRLPVPGIPSRCSIRLILQKASSGTWQTSSGIRSRAIAAAGVRATAAGGRNPNKALVSSRRPQTTKASIGKRRPRGAVSIKPSAITRRFLLLIILLIWGILSCGETDRGCQFDSGQGCANRSAAVSVHASF